MSDRLRLYYLQTMGIDVWQTRDAPETAEPTLTSLAEEVAACTLCPLHKTRTNTVFSRGNTRAKLMIIGEAPGYFEDQQGLPFVGKAGMLLDQMLKSIDLTNDDVYIANVLKCRPPNNRDPNSNEITQCSAYLAQQIQMVNPKLILALGRFAGQFLLKKLFPLKQLRQNLHFYENVPFRVSYHPAYLLRNPIDKKKAYADLQNVRKFLLEN